jgi:putative salt-induced outer membrane protein YdiY
LLFDFKRITLILILLIFLTLITQADEGDKKEKKAYSSSTSFSVLMTSGNTQELTLGFDTEQNLNFKKNEIQFKGGIIYSQSNGAKESELYYGYLEYSRSLSTKAYLLGLGQFESNELSGYKYRFALAVGAGYFLIKSEKFELSSELTLGWSKENNIEKIKNTDLKLSFASSLITSKMKIKISSNSELVMHEIFFINLDNTNDYRLSSLGSLSVSISRYIALKVSHQLKYNHSPVPGFKSTDQYLLSSLILNF